MKFIYTGILLQIVRVSPETHLVKHHESQSRTIESQLKKKKKKRKENLKLKMLGPVFDPADKRHSFVTRNED